jgi:hypothetical protein
MRPLLALLAGGLLLLAPCQGLQIRTSNGPSKFAGGLVRDATYKASM